MRNNELIEKNFKLHMRAFRRFLSISVHSVNKFKQIPKLKEI
jgi:hypothetical protein